MRVYGAHIKLRLPRPLPLPLFLNGQHLSVPLALEVLKSRLKSDWTPVVHNMSLHCQFVNVSETRLAHLGCSHSGARGLEKMRISNHWVNPGAVKALLAKLPPPGHPFTLEITTKNGNIAAIYHYGDPEGWRHLRNFSRDHLLFLKAIRDRNTAARIRLRRYAKSGDATAEDQLAVLYWKQHHPQKAVEWLHRAVLKGSHRAQIMLGLFYSLGVGVIRNYHTAAQLYWRAAEAYYPSGLFNLGTLYLHGHGVSRDQRLGLAYQKAALLEGLHVKSKTERRFKIMFAHLNPKQRKSIKTTAMQIALNASKIRKPRERR